MFLPGRRWFPYTSPSLHFHKWDLFTIWSLFSDRCGFLFFQIFTCLFSRGGLLPCFAICSKSHSWRIGDFLFLHILVVIMDFHLLFKGSFPFLNVFRMISILHSVVLVCELVLCCFSIESFFLLIHLFLLLGNSICLVIVVWFLACCQFHQIGFGLYCCPLDSFCLKSTFAHFDWPEFPFFDFWVFSVSLLVVSVGWFHYSSIIWDFISLILSIIIIFNALVR